MHSILFHSSEATGSKEQKIFSNLLTIDESILREKAQEFKLKISKEVLEQTDMFRRK